MSKKLGLGKVLAGVGIGVGLGMLLSPKSGEENRKDLKKQVDKVTKKIKDVDLNAMKEDLLKEYSKLKRELKTMDGEKAKKIAKAKIDELSTKATELIDAAKDKSAPMVEKTARDIKKKLAEVLSDMAEKLED